MKTNLIAIVVDQSGSMAYLEKDLKQRTQKLLNDIRARKDQDNRVGVYTFSGYKVNGPFQDYPAGFGGGSTPLFEAVGKAIEDLDKMHPTNGGFPWEQNDVAKLVIVLTDGENTDHIRWTSQMVTNAIKQRQNSG